MKQTKKKTWFRATSRRISLALVSVFVLGSFLLSMFVVPASVSAQGQQCLRSNWNFLFDWKTVTVDSITGIDSSITTTAETMQVEVFITPSDSSDIVYWGNVDDRQYSLEATRTGNSGAAGTETVPVRAISPGASGQLRLLFNLPGSTFTQLVNDQQTGYALTLKSSGRGDCFVKSYTATREDGTLPPVICEAKTYKQCGAAGGCGQNETCNEVGVNFECQKIPNSCGYQLACGKTATSSTDTCSCSGTSFTPMTGGSRCCGWVYDGACQATAPPAPFPDCGIPITSGTNTMCQLTASDGSTKNLFISGGTGPEAYQCSSEPTKCCSQASSCQPLRATCGRTQLVNGETRCVVGANNFPLGETSGLTMCTADNKFCCTDGAACTKVIAEDLAANPPADPDPADPADSSSEPPGETSPSDEGSLLDAIKGPTNKTFDALNPLNISAGLKGESTKSPYLRSFATPGGVVSRLLLFAFPIAGIILFLMIVWGGFEMVTGAANAKSMDAGKQRITAAVIGFILLFVSYWLMQLIELIFGLSIL